MVINFLHPVATCYSNGSELMTVNAHVNSTAIIECPCNQTGQVMPQWIINDGPPLMSNQLSSRHTVIIMSLNIRIFPVEQSDNGSTYQCVFQPLNFGPTGIKIKLIINPEGKVIARYINILNIIFCNSETVRIIEGPRDVEVEEGDTAEFSCFFTRTSSTPCWIINDTVYSIDELPSGHFYRNKTLLVTDVDSSLNSTTYQCQIHHIMSSVAILIVLPGT